jgi:hypothetical protein
MTEFNIVGFEVTTNSDTTEGRGHSVHVAYTSNLVTAHAIAVGKGVMGSPADVNPINKKIIICDTISDYEFGENEKVKISALAKLSEKEKRALGLIK